MVDREKVISGLHYCTHTDGVNCRDCPYDLSVSDCTAQMSMDVLELLKELETEIEHLKRPDCEHAEHDGIGCLGYCGCTQDDEPIESCKKCEKYTGNVYEETKWE